MKIVETALLALVVIHAIQHMPHDIRSDWQAIQRFVRRRLGDGPYPLRFRILAAVVMVLVASISLAPVLYYGLECGTHLYAPPIVGA